MIKLMGKWKNMLYLLKCRVVKMFIISVHLWIYVCGQNDWQTNICLDKLMVLLASHCPLTNHYVGYCP